MLTQFLLPKNVITKSLVASLVIGIATLVSAGILNAQPNGAPSDPWRERATRAELTAIAENNDLLAASAKSTRVRGNHTKIAQQARQRLEQGDLKVGDKFYLEVAPPFEALNDTIVVRTGQMILLPNKPDIPVRGVLRTELDAHLTREISKIHNNVRLRTVPLIRVAVSGAVVSAGFRTARTDAILSDIVTMSGGFATDVNMKNLKIRRRRDVLWDKEATLLAVDDGWTLDSLRLISGDEFVVGRRPPNRFTTVVQLVTSVTALVVGIITLSRLP